MQTYGIMRGHWGMGQMIFTKYGVVVDADVNVHNTIEVLFLLREILLHPAAREGLFPACCLMPDHLHFFWMGLRLDTDQRNGMKFLRERLGPALRPHRFQHLPRDHVPREHKRKRNAFAAVCR